MTYLNKQQEELALAVIDCRAGGGTTWSQVKSIARRVTKYLPRIRGELNITVYEPISRSGVEIHDAAPPWVEGAKSCYPVLFMPGKTQITRDLLRKEVVGLEAYQNTGVQTSLTLSQG